MSRFTVLRLHGPILPGPQRFRDQLVAAMRREPIAYVDDRPEDDPDNPGNAPGPWDVRNSQQWSFLALLFVLTVVIAVSPVAIGAARSDGADATPANQTTTIPATEEPSGCDAEPCIEWSPHRLTCTGGPCDQEVTVRSVGAKPLRVTGLKFTGDAADRLSARGTCLGPSLTQDVTCSITVSVRPGKADSAQLRIEQNVSGAASVVDINVEATPTGCEAEPCIEWSPRRLTCSDGPCDQEVTVRSVGAKPLRFTGLKFTGRVASRLSAKDTCRGKSLTRERTCSITVSVRPGAAGRAQLRIQQNLVGDASLVDIEVEAAPSTPTQPDLDLSIASALECSVLPPNEHFSGHLLTVAVTVLNSGPDRPAQSVGLTLSSKTGRSGTATVDLTGGSAVTPVQVKLTPDDYDREHRFTASVDPTDDVVEQDESNNARDVIVYLPDEPPDAQEVKCTTG